MDAVEAADPDPGVLVRVVAVPARHAAVQHIDCRVALKVRIETQPVQMNTIVVDGKLGPNVKPWDSTVKSRPITKETA